MTLIENHKVYLVRNKKTKEVIMETIITEDQAKEMNTQEPTGELEYILKETEKAKPKLTKE